MIPEVSQTMTTPTISGGTLKSNVTLKNDTEQDTDGGKLLRLFIRVSNRVVRLAHWLR